MLQIKAIARSVEHRNQLADIFVFINYSDLEGALAMVRHYITEEGWDQIEIEDEYIDIESLDEIDEDHLPYYEEAKEHGYCIVFYTYESQSDSTA